MDITSPLLIHKRGFSPLWHFFPKAKALIRKISDKPKLRDMADYFLKAVKVVKDRERLRNCHRREHGFMTTKCKVVPWISSWNRNRITIENQINLEFSE